jgi:hypothetical protein
LHKSNFKINSALIKDIVSLDSGLVSGIKEDQRVEFKMDDVTDTLINHGIDHVCTNEGTGGDKGHAEWKHGGQNLRVI